VAETGKTVAKTFFSLRVFEAPLAVQKSSGLLGFDLSPPGTGLGGLPAAWDGCGPCGVPLRSARHLRAIVEMDPRAHELVRLTMLACIVLGLAWAFDETVFTVVFAAEATL
jgi:hypothetical protein